MPVICACRLTTVIGSSVTLVAEIFIPFLKPFGSVSRPSTMNLWPRGIVNCWLVPSSSVRIKRVGGVTRQTVPVTVPTVVTNLGVVVTVIVRSNFVPGFKS